MHQLILDNAEDVSALVSGLPAEAGAYCEPDDGSWFVYVGGQYASLADGLAADLSGLKKQRLIQYAAAARWLREVGGVAIGGVPVATDDRSKQMIIGARIAADADPNWTTQWVGADGAIYPIDAAAIITISNAVQAHVNACFATYASVKAQIDAGTITTTAAIDAAFAA